MKQGRQGGNNMRRRDGQRKIRKIILFLVYKGDRLFLNKFSFHSVFLALSFIFSLYVVYHLTSLFPLSFLHVLHPFKRQRIERMRVNDKKKKWKYWKRKEER